MGSRYYGIDLIKFMPSVWACLTAMPCRQEEQTAVRRSIRQASAWARVQAQGDFKCDRILQRHDAAARALKPRCCRDVLWLPSARRPPS